jgi:hypothetical protein
VKVSGGSAGFGAAQFRSDLQPSLRIEVERHGADGIGAIGVGDVRAGFPDREGVDLIDGAGPPHDVAFAVPGLRHAPRSEVVPLEAAERRGVRPRSQGSLRAVVEAEIFDRVARRTPRAAPLRIERKHAQEAVPDEHLPVVLPGREDGPFDLPAAPLFPDHLHGVRLFAVGDTDHFLRVEFSADALALVEARRVTGDHFLVPLGLRDLVPLRREVEHQQRIGPRRAGELGIARQRCGIEGQFGFVEGGSGGDGDGRTGAEADDGDGERRQEAMQHGPEPACRSRSCRSHGYRQSQPGKTNRRGRNRSILPGPGPQSPSNPDDFTEGDRRTLILISTETGEPPIEIKVEMSVRT